MMLTSGHVPPSRVLGAGIRLQRIKVWMGGEEIAMYISHSFERFRYSEGEQKNGRQLQERGDFINGRYQASIFSNSIDFWCIKKSIAERTKK